MHHVVQEPEAAGRPFRALGLYQPDTVHRELVFVECPSHNYLTSRFSRQFESHLCSQFRRQ